MGSFSLTIRPPVSRVSSPQYGSSALSGSTLSFSDASPAMKPLPVRHLLLAVLFRCLICRCALDTPLTRAASYFTTLCYEVGGELVSMAELEHCILRAKTSAPKQASAEHSFSSSLANHVDVEHIQRGALLR